MSFSCSLPVVGKLLFASTAKEVSHLTGKITRGLSQINANG
jgi:hypothetical protein